MDQLGVKISLPKSLISRRGALEFAKKFLILGKDLSPISMKMLRSVTYPVAWMPVCKSVGVSSLRTSLRLRGAGYRRYSSQPHHFNPQTDIGSGMFWCALVLIVLYLYLSRSG